MASSSSWQAKSSDRQTLTRLRTCAARKRTGRRSSCSGWCGSRPRHPGPPGRRGNPAAAPAGNTSMCMDSVRLVASPVDVVLDAEWHRLVELEHPALLKTSNCYIIRWRARVVLGTWSSNGCPTAAGCTIVAASRRPTLSDGVREEVGRFYSVAGENRCERLRVGRRAHLQRRRVHLHAPSAASPVQGRRRLFLNARRRAGPAGSKNGAPCRRAGRSDHVMLARMDDLQQPLRTLTSRRTSCGRCGSSTSRARRAATCSATR